MIYALTLHQPWASLIAIGKKPFETRDRPAPEKLIGERIAIHAGLWPVDASLETEFDFMFTIAFGGDLGWSATLPLGAVLCTARLAGSYRCERLSDDMRPIEVRHSPRSPTRQTIPFDAFGDYRPGRWAYHLVDLETFGEPVPTRGKQGFWIWKPPAS